jgi:hypothetical protein
MRKKTYWKTMGCCVRREEVVLVQIGGDGGVGGGLLLNARPGEVDIE